MMPTGRFKKVDSERCDLEVCRACSGLRAARMSILGVLCITASTETQW